MKDLVELVQKARWNKMMAGLATLGGALTVKLNNLAAMEINAGEALRGGGGTRVRPCRLRVLRGMCHLLTRFQATSAP